MTQRVKAESDFQLPSGQLWWRMRFFDGDRVSETLFTFEGERQQTWYFARQRAEIILREMSLENTNFLVSLYGQASLHS